MKKTVTFIMSLILCLSLISCNDKETNKTPDNNGGDNGSIVYPEDGYNAEDDSPVALITASIVKNDGDNTTATAEELIETFNNNQEHFNKYYTNANITFNGTIKSILKNQMTMISDNVWEYRDVVVVFEEGFCLVNPPQDLAEFSAGDVVEVSGNIITATTHMMLTVHGPTGSDPTVWVDGSTMGILTVPQTGTIDINSLSVTEFVELFNDNQDKFNKYCTGKTITRTSKISSISKDQMTMVSDSAWEYKEKVVIFEDGFCLVNPPQELADYLPGDTVTFSGNIITATTHMMLTVHGPTKSDPTVWVDGSTAGIIS